jgi:lysophospholipase L1-like esterase
MIAHLALAAAFLAEVAAPSEYLKDVQAEMRKLWPKNRTIHIVAHGHSVPAGYFKTPFVNTFEAYPHLLHSAIKDAYPNAVVNVIVTAIGGENSEQGAKRFQRDVLAFHPDVIVIDYGLNDRRIGLDRARKAWTRMIRAAQSRKIKVILLTPTPDDKTDLSDSNAPLVQHADQIRALAAQFNVGLADSLKAFEGKDVAAFLSQSNHPNRAGHQLVLQQLTPYFIANP